jgi:hypothetical protein
LLLLIEDGKQEDSTREESGLGKACNVRQTPKVG